MLGFLKRRAFLTLVGFLLIAVFIWYAGPYVAFAEYQPLEPENNRIILILVIVALWGVSRLVRKWRAYRASDQLAAAVVKQVAAEPARPSAEAVQLRERFEEAVATLKGSRRSGHSLYDLPWYVIIGAPGSGKTTALLNSGLKFPLEQQLGKEVLRGIGGTRNCDWLFTDEAVFLDTAGRYTTQDSDASSDSAAWAEFLALLVKYRKRRPVNGVILTITAQDLLTPGPRGREFHVQAARRRLTELNTQLGIQLPVYVMVTKCDLVAGFTEYFEDLTQEARAQVWGVTSPYEQTLKGEAAAAFPAEFDQLIARLNGRVFARVEDDRNVRRRTRIFAFPQQMAALREALSGFVSEVFASTRMDQPILLRGVYFTSGTQEGTPIDRLLGAIGRRYGVAPDVVAPTGRGKAYFVERLLKEVLIAESGLAGVNRRFEMKKAAIQLGAYAALALAAVAGVILFSVSASRNRAYIAETAQALTALDSVPPAAPSVPVEALLPRLNAIRAVVDVADQYRGGVPWSMRWGLYQGNSLGNAARDAYVQELDGTLLPRIAARIEERLGQYGSDPEKLYEFLKAYRMLGEPRRLDKKHLQYVAGLEWHADDTAVPDAGVTLTRHFDSLLEYQDSLPAMVVNGRLIAQAQSTLQQASIRRIIFGRLKRTYAEEPAGQVLLAQAAGIGAERVLKRKSGTELSEPISSFYSKPGFKKVTGEQIGTIVKQFAADDWVWGEDRKSFTVTNTLNGEVLDLYEADYIATWDGVLDDLELVPFSTPAQMAEALRSLTGATSPLRGLLAAVAENTSLVDAPAPPDTGAIASAKKALGARFGGMANKLPNLRGTAVVPGQLVTSHFQPIHRLMAGDAGGAPIDVLLQKIDQMSQYLSALANSPGGIPPDALSNPAFLQLRQGLEQDVAAFPPLIQRLIGQIGRTAEVSVGSSVSSDLDRRYRQEVIQPCSRAIDGRYPFTPTALEDLPVQDFIRLFAAGGLFDSFFTENLQDLVDTTQSPWTWNPGAVTGSRAMLESLEAADRVRRLFFRGGTSLGLRFTLSFSELVQAIPRMVVEIDGKFYDSDGPRQPLQAVWPGPTPGRASVRFSGRAGITGQSNFDGAWGLFRMFGEHARVVNETRLMLGFDINGYDARVIVDADRIDNPFTNRDWQRFDCGV